MAVKSLILTVVFLFAVFRWSKQIIALLDKFILSKSEIIPLDIDHAHISYGNKLILGSGYFPSLGNIELDDQGRALLKAGDKEIVLGKTTQSGNSDYLFGFSVEDGDSIQFSYRHSVAPWLTFFEFNFMTGHSPSKKRNAYYALTWIKKDGSQLHARWKFEQWKYNGGNGWGNWNRVYVIDGRKDDLIDLVIEKK
jgi:hypothetical protein